MAKSARARSTCAAGALSERLRRVNSWRSSAVSGRRGSFWWRDMAHLADEDHRTTIPVPTADDPMGVAIGATVQVPTARGDWPVEIVGIYSDYGNPKGQLWI